MLECMKVLEMTIPLSFRHQMLRKSVSRVLSAVRAQESGFLTHPIPGDVKYTKRVYIQFLVSKREKEL